MNRWQQRLAEFDGDGSLTRAVLDVQNVHNVRNAQNSEASRPFVQIEQSEQHEGPPSAPDGDAPDSLDERIGELISRPCPNGPESRRWTILCRGVECFADRWAVKALSLGWTFDELFALAEPLANVSLQGAAWFIGESTVTAVTADAITLRTQRGAMQRVYRKASSPKSLRP